MRTATHWGIGIALTVLALQGWPRVAESADIAPKSDSLQAAFIDPPASARPRVWWHWMNGNITQEGIREDLEWMRRAGIGGVQNFEVNLVTPKIVKQRLTYMTPEWQSAFRFATDLAEHLDLEFAIASSPGFSETGGPWVQPQDALKKLVWSETVIEGGKPFKGTLPAPPSVTGAFQTLPLNDPLTASVQRPTYYADVAVLAYPAAKSALLPAPQVSSIAGETIDAARLTDGDLTSAIEIGRTASGQPNALILTYRTPQTVRSADLLILGQSQVTDLALAPRLEASTDGLTWQPVADLPLGAIPTTVSFSAVTARQFRLLLVPRSASGFSLGQPAAGAAGGEMFAGFAAAGAKRPVKIAEFRLSAEAAVDRFEAKAGFSVEEDYYALDARGGSDSSGVSPKDVIDLTQRMKPDGTLDWKPPRGRWRVLRLGCSLLGTMNHPAPSEATGLEVDKFDAEAVEAYLRNYLGQYAETLGSDRIGAHGVRALLNDSIEVGAANWTPRMIAKFEQLRGYDPTPWLPALAGVVVGSRSQSDAFLYDYRRTLSDLIASAHYGTVASVAHQLGLKVYGEALEDRRPSLGDDMAMRAHTDVPMGAMWTYPREGEPKPTYLADIKGAASVAHVYGQNLVGAESLTSILAPWAFAPNDLKRIVDLEFALGVNLPVIHTSVHQPLDDKLPGLRLFIFGQDFNRHETWAEMARPWVDYLARTSFLLQQGRYVADVAYFYGEEAPLTGLYGHKPVADAPTGFGYDFLNADALMSKVHVENDGELTTEGGERYKVLYLGGSSRHMTLPLLERIASLVEAGATVVGDAPESSPSLKDDKTALRRLVNKLWSGSPVTRVGQGRIIAGHDIESALSSLKTKADFSYSKSQSDSQILFVHRQLDDGDLYFLSNRTNHPEHAEAHFRVLGKQPQIWRAETGNSEAVSYRSDDSGTTVPLDMEAEESLFVVFRQPATVASRVVEQPKYSSVDLTKPWAVELQPKQGEPRAIKLETLGSLSEQSDPAVKYFSGVATYRTSFDLPKHGSVGGLLIDLGQVGDLAEIRVNGAAVGTVWHPPYRLNISSATRPGRNQLEIRVADLWVNRLIGDAQPGTSKTTWTPMPAYRADAPLRPSGLIGPVRLMFQGAPSVH